MGIEPFSPRENLDKSKPKGQFSPDKLIVKTRSLFNEDIPNEFNN